MNQLSSGFALAAAVFLAAASSGAGEEGPREFLRQLYSHYPSPASKAAFDPTGRSSQRVFDPSLVALLRQAARLAPRGDVGVIDGDPVCDCQDDAGLKAQIETVRLKDAAHATVVVNLLFQEAQPPERRRLDYDMVSVAGHWRVFDIHTRTTPSLRALLITSIKSAQSQP